MHRDSQQAIANTSLVTLLFVVMSAALFVFINGPKTISFLIFLFLVSERIQNTDCEPHHISNTTPFKLPPPPLTIFYENTVLHRS